MGFHFLFKIWAVFLKTPEGLGGGQYVNECTKFPFELKLCLYGAMAELVVARQRGEVSGHCQRPAATCDQLVGFPLIVQSALKGLWFYFIFF